MSCSVGDDNGTPREPAMPLHVCWCEARRHSLTITRASRSLFLTTLGLTNAADATNNGLWGPSLIAAALWRIVEMRVGRALRLRKGLRLRAYVPSLDDHALLCALATDRANTQRPTIRS
jgi:hypothetical protein